MAEDFDAVTTEEVSDTMPKEAAPQEKETPQTAEPEPQTEEAQPESQEETAPPVTEEKPQAEKVEEESMMHHVFTELREIHRICQNFHAGRMRDAEAELEKYHEIDRGRAFDEILRDVARIYVDHESLPAAIEDEALRKRVNNILLDVLQVLEGYGVHLQRSSQGSERKLRLTHVVGYEDTEDPELHGKIAASVQAGFCRENLAVMQELVKIYRKVN